MGSSSRSKRTPGAARAACVSIAGASLARADGADAALNHAHQLRGVERLSKDGADLRRRSQLFGRTRDHDDRNRTRLGVLREVDEHLLARSIRQAEIECDQSGSI